MRRLFRIAVLFAGVAGAPRVGAAQATLHGVVRDSTASTPLPGAVISIIDSSGAATARTIADADGRFAITIRSRAARLHLIRIGYKPRELPLPDAAHRTDELRLALVRLPAMLEAVHVSDSELCPGSTDRGAAFDVWEQARAGLLATVVAREAKPAMAKTLTYDRRLSIHDERVLAQSVRLQTGRTTRPFVAAEPPSTFASHGYMVEDTLGRLFNAPDADVLLDESFAATHCFHLQAADAAHPGQIGLAFTPVPGRLQDTLVDVRGVIWIERHEPQLRSLDFSYTALEPAAMDAKTGGVIEFRTMPNGVAFVERWHLRLPVMTQGVNPLTSAYRVGVGPARPPRRQSRHDLRVAEIAEAGGIVRQAQWSDGTVWRDTPTGVIGEVVQRRTGAAVENAIVMLEGTADSARTDADGMFSLPALPGRYAVIAIDTTLRAYVAERREIKVVDVAQSVPARVHLELPAVAEVTAQVCRSPRMTDILGTIAGHVRTAANLPREVRVRATWLADINYGMNVAVDVDNAAHAARPVALQKGDELVDLDGAGRFLICGVALERPITLSLVLDKQVLADTMVKVEAGIKAVEWAPAVKERP